jgi:acyl-coenzyme A thioesterase PaaI-like protein
VSEDAPSADELAMLVASIPYARFLGLRAELAGDEMTVILPYSDHLIGNPALPALHGGVLGALMELTAVAQLAILHAADAGPSADGRRPRLPKPVDVTVEYLRSGRPRDTYARAAVKKRGRRIANVHVEAWQDARANPIASLHGHFMLPPPAEPAPDA